MSPKVILLAFALANLAAIFYYLRARQSAAERARNSTFVWEYLYAGVRDPALVTRHWVRQAYGEGFTLQRLMLVVFLSGFALLALLAEFYFLQLTFALVLNELPETAAVIGGLKVSHILALFICAVSVVAGMFARDAAHSFWLKLFAWNVLGVVCLIEAYLGYTRAGELTILGSLQTALAGGTAPAQQPLAGFAWANAALGFINPVLAALTATYLLSLVTWTLASAIALVLFVCLWFPTWIAQAVVLRRRDGRPTNPTAPTATDNENGNTAAQQPDAPLGAENQAANDPAAERAAEEQDKLREYEEAERRRRDQAYAQPFGLNHSTFNHYQSGETL